MLTRHALAALFLLPATALTACGSDQNDAAESDGGQCTYTAAGPAARDVDLPPSEPTVDGPATAVLKTNVGDLTITLDGKATPCTVNSFLSLAAQDYFDDTPCPRLASDSTFGLLQCGDPSGTGSGGPGYTIPDEITGTETYPAGTVAMANTGMPDSGGSQFFLVFTDSRLSPDYTVFGHVDGAGVAILQGVGAKGDDGSHPAGGGEPNQPVDIKDVVVG